jgi:hypothetical protein
MANYHYQYQNFYYSWFLFIVFILFKQDSILAIAQPNQVCCYDLFLFNSYDFLLISLNKLIDHYFYQK